MRMYTVYVCETCEYESKSFDDMEEHEAKHLGLTVEELHTYSALKSLAEYTGSVVANRNNEKTRAAFDKAVEKLVAFEQEHSIKK